VKQEKDHITRSGNNIRLVVDITFQENHLKSISPIELKTCSMHRKL
jgi:hypothetical protein